MELFCHVDPLLAKCRIQHWQDHVYWQGFPIELFQLYALVPTYADADAPAEESVRVVFAEGIAPYDVL